MPYKVLGPDLYHKKDGKWKIKQHCKSHENALSAMKLLNAKEHGWKPE
jgi:hypothetical protein